MVVVDTDTHPRGKSADLWQDLVGSVLGVRSRTASAVGVDDGSGADAAGQVAVLGPLLGLRLAGQRYAHLNAELQAELTEGLLARLLRAAAAANPLLIVVENAHHLDEGSNANVWPLCPVTCQAQVGILTERVSNGPLDATPPGWERLGLGRAHLDRSRALAVDPGGRPRRCAPAWLADAVHRRAGGNPLFVKTVTRALHANWEPGHPAPEDHATGRLTGLLAERVDRLPVSCRQLLDVLAVARRPCAPQVLAALLPDTVDIQAVRCSPPSSRAST